MQVSKNDNHEYYEYYSTYQTNMWTIIKSIIITII